MEPNQNQQNQPNMAQSQTPTAPPAGTVPPPVMPNETQESFNDSKSNGKIILFFAIGILLLIVLGIIYFMANKLNSQSKTEVFPTPTQVPTPTLSPTPTPLSEQDIDTIDLGNPETDLNSIENDVKQL